METVSINPFQEVYLAKSFNLDQWNKLSSNAFADDGSLFASLCVQELYHRNDSKFKAHLLSFLREQFDRNTQFCSLIFIRISKLLNLLNRRQASLNLSKQVLPLFRLICHWKWSVLDDNNKKLFVEVVLLVVSIVSKSKSSKINLKCFETFHNWIKRFNNQEEFVGILKRFTQEDLAIPCCVVWNFIARINSELFQAHKAAVLDLIVKYVIMSKNIVNQILHTDSLNAIMQQIDCVDFKSTVFPSIQKAILRNSEIALGLLSLIFTNLKIDLSEYSTELSKIIGSNIKIDNLQEETLKAVTAIALLLQTSNSVEVILQHLTNVYNGKEGKLSLASQKTGILKAMSILANNSVQDKTQLFNSALNCFFSIIKLETLEANVQFCFVQMKVWFDSCPNIDVDEQFWKNVKDYRKSKFSQATLGHFYACIVSYLHNAKTKKLDDDLLNAVITSSKNVSLPISKIVQLNECINACVILLQLNITDKLLSNLKDLEKINFLTDKFVEDSSDNLSTICVFIELICLQSDFSSKTEIRRVLLRLMTNSNRDIRKKASLVYKKIFSTNPNYVVELLCLYDVLFEQEKTTNNGLIKCFNVLTQFDSFSNEVNMEDVLWKSFKVCHIAPVFDAKPNVFFTIAKRSLEGKRLQVFYENYVPKIVQLIFDSSINAKTRMNIVKANSSLSWSKFLPELIFQIERNLNSLSDDLLKIQPFEYAVFKMPDDEIFNKEAVISAASGGDKNQKRENKLYSYKEQLADLEFQKEQQAKIRASFDVSKLNKKQQEVYKQELDKEKDIRKKLKLIMDPFEICLNVLNTLFERDSLLTSIQFKNILFVMIKLLGSIACREDVIKFLHSISLKMMPDGGICFINLIFMLTETIIRIQLQDASSDELNELVDEILSALYVRTCPNTMGEYDEKQNRLAEQNRLPTSGFVFAFPLIEYALKKSLKDPEDNDWAKKCLQIIIQHHLIRSSSFDLGVPFDTKNPQNLPVSTVIDLLVMFQEKNNQPQLEELACEALTAVGDCMNGGEGCGRADDVVLDKLFNGLFHSNGSIRETCSSVLSDFNDSIFNDSSRSELCRRKMHQRAFVATFDSLRTVVLNCEDILSRFTFLNDSKKQLLDDIVENDIEMANASLIIPIGKAVEAIVNEDKVFVKNLVERLQVIYNEKVKEAIPKLDKFGRVLDREHVDRFERRLAIASILTRCVQFFGVEQIKEVVQFLIPSALSDINSNVQAMMLELGIVIIDLHGAEHAEYLLSVFENFLDTTTDNKETEIIRQSVIVLMGTLAAKHIKKTDPKLRSILSVLCGALNTDSSMVQSAVATCLTELTPKFAQDSDVFIKKLLDYLFDADTLEGQRRGAAYGVSGIIKGLGISSIHKFGIMQVLMKEIASKSPHKREGALFAFEMLSRMLGQVFEPYVVDILPVLLDCFADSILRVRTAADKAAKIIMSNLTARGVTIIYPAMLKALEDENWRKRVSSIELLASMAYCAPRQLSTCLPKIVPKLIQVINDTHPKVEKSAAEALKQIGSVIKNPEIQKIVPTLMNSLQDPANKTNTTLNVMLNMKFVHIIDPPSLALIMPVVERAFQNRSSETRKMAAQIIGNMNALTKKKDLSPYLPAIIPGLKNSLLDPVPEVRSVTARALGAMVKCLGEEVLSELMPWLKAMLVSETSSVDRSGAAQGLSEVLGGLGLESLHKIVPEIVAITERSDVQPYVKDGYMMMFIYLPLVFTQHFANYIGQVINPILQALADETEYVRETSLRAGQRIVNMYAETAIQLLLPELEAGLFDENWRIRYSSVQLLGDLLFKILGVSGKMTTESGHEDDNFGTESSSQTILVALGLERRNRILSGLYMARSDVALQVRQASLHVWKVVVPNTPRLLREILPTLFTILLGSLASNRTEAQQIAARTLGDLVRKLGERILPEIIPILENGLESEDSAQRQGVCIGLSEIIASTSKEMIQAFADSLIPTVEKALFDSLADVRLVAAQTFDNLYAAIGTKALDEILPTCIDSLDKAEMNERTLDTLKNIIQFRSRVVLPYLIPKLTAPPINTRALALIASVAGDSLSKYLSKIIPALLLAISESVDTKFYNKCLENSKEVVMSVTDDEGSSELVVTLIEFIKEGDVNSRRASITLLVAYCVQAKPYQLESFHLPLWRGLVQFLAYDDEFIVNEATQALNVLVKNMDSSDQLELLPEVSNFLRYAIADCVENAQDKTDVILPGFRSNKGFLPLYTIFKEGMLSSNLDNKVFGISGLRDIVKYSTPDALKPSIMIMAGTLLRIVNTITSEDVKILLAEVLRHVLKKCGIVLRIFHPQIQSFLFRSLADVNRTVRLEVSRSLSALAVVHNKLDVFVIELLSLLAKLPYDPLRYHETGYYGLRLIVEQVGDQLSDETIDAIINQVPEMEIIQKEDCIRVTAASVIGALLMHLKDDKMENVMRKYVMYDKVEEEWIIRHFRSVVIRVSLCVAFDRVTSKKEWMDRIHSNILGYICSKKETLAVSGIYAAAFLFDSSFQRGLLPLQSIIHAYCKAMNGTLNDVKAAVAESTIWWANRREDFDQIVIKNVVPMLVNGTKERNSAVRSNSEYALVAFLKLKNENSNVYKKTEKILDQGAVESLNDTLVKLKKIIAKVEFKDEHYDRTLLS